MSDSYISSAQQRSAAQPTEMAVAMSAGHLVTALFLLKLCLVGAQSATIQVGGGPL